MGLITVLGNIILQTNFISGSKHGVRDAAFSWWFSIFIPDRPAAICQA